jgi:hypothetical protein
MNQRVEEIEQVQEIIGSEVRLPDFILMEKWRHLTVKFL